MSLVGFGLILVALVALGGLALIVVLVFVIKGALKKAANRALHEVSSVGQGLVGGAGGALARIGERELASGWASFKRTLDRELLESDPERMERAVTKLAQRRKGDLAVAEVVAELEVPAHVAREAFERLRRREVCERHEDGAGERYVFPAFKERRPVKLCDYCGSMFEPDEADAQCGACGAPLRDALTT